MRINFLPTRTRELLDSGHIDVKELTALYEHTFPEGTGDKLIGPAIRNSHAMQAMHLAFHRVVMRELYHGPAEDAANLAALRLWLLMVERSLTKGEGEITPEKFWVGMDIQLDSQTVTKLLDPDVSKEAILHGLQCIQHVDRGSLAWAEDGYTPSLKNALIEARDVMDFIGEFLTLPQNSIWQHVRKGDYYRVMGGANQASTDQKKFPPMVIYQDNQRNTWARPLSEFLESFQHRYNLYNHQQRRPGQIEHGT